MDQIERQFARQVRLLVDEYREQLDDVRLCRLLGGIENDLAAGEYEPTPETVTDVASIESD